MNKSLSNKITNINFILTVMIVILHSSVLKFIDNNNISFFYKIINTICDSAVPLFFLLSAFLFFRNLDFSKIIYKIKKRIKTLVVPYFMWANIWLIYYYFISMIPEINKYFSLPFKFDMLSIIKNIIFASCAETMWFVRVLIFYTIFSPITFILMKNKKISWLIIILCFLLNLCLKFSYSSPMFWLPIYFLGANVALNYKDFIEFWLIKKNDNKLLLCFSIFIIIIMILIATFSGEYSKQYYVYRFLSPLVFLVLISYNNVLIKKPKKFSNKTFWIFCTHLPVIQLIRKMFILVFGVSNIGLLITFVATIICTLVVTIFIGNLLEKKLSILYKILTGGR